MLKSPAQDVLGLVALSPPPALLRSPAISGLTKTYEERFQGTPSDAFSEARYGLAAEYARRCGWALCHYISCLLTPLWMMFQEFELTTSYPIIEPTMVEAFGLAPPFNLA